jgi:hypothetical protein
VSDRKIAWNWTISPASAGLAPVRIRDHLVLIVVCAMIFGAFVRSARTGTTATPAASPVTLLLLIMLILSCPLWCLSRLGTCWRVRWVEALSLPLFLALVFTYLTVSMIAYFCVPEAAVLVVFAQLTALVYASLRV